MKEKILVSACLLGTNCKYSGGNNYSEEVMEYLKDISEKKLVIMVSHNEQLAEKYDTIKWVIL